MAKNVTAEQALQIVENQELPRICDTLNPKQKLFAEAYCETLNINEACKSSGYSQTYGFQLLRDARIQAYLTYLRNVFEAVSVISKGQLLEKIGQRVLSKDIKDSDLASLSREIRYLLNYGQENPTTLINIELPDTYNKFFKKQKDSQVENIIEEWE